MAKCVTFKTPYSIRMKWNRENARTFVEPNSNTTNIYINIPLERDCFPLHINHFSGVSAYQLIDKVFVTLVCSRMKPARAKFILNSIPSTYNSRWIFKYKCIRFIFRYLWTNINISTQMLLLNDVCTWNHFVWHRVCYYQYSVACQFCVLKAFAQAIELRKIQSWDIYIHNLFLINSVLE